MRTFAAALTGLAATGVLLTGCHGPASRGTSESASTPATSVHNSPAAAEPAELEDVDSTLDRIERELNSDADR